jgi:hypothetical protein
MEAAPESEAARLRFFDALSGAELFLLLEAEAGADSISPRTFPLEGETYVLAFDTEERLATFTGEMAPYAALPGRALAQMLAAEGMGLALNPEVAPSATFLPPDAMAWLTETLAQGPAEVAELPLAVAPPAGIPELLLTALDAKLATATGLARHAWLAGVTYDGGRESHLLAFVDALPGAEAGLARAMSEALIFSGIEAGQFDIGFFRESDAAIAQIAKVGLRFDIPQPDAGLSPNAPGMDPARPPRLR